jgi:uncharacterized protein (DUF433 family)
MTLPDFLTQLPDGEISLTGHRIGLYHIVHYYREGFSPEMLACQYPTVPLATIHKVIAYYLEHQAEVDAYVAACREQLDQQRLAQPSHPDMATLRKRLDARRHVEVP